MSELIPVREAARRLGVSHTAVSKAINAGRITVADRLANGRVMLKWPDVGEEWVANSDGSKRSHVGGTRRKSVLPTSDRMDDLPDFSDDDSAGEPATATAGGGAARSAPGGASKKSGPKSGRGPDYAKSRADREKYQALLAQLEYEQKIAKLVDAEEVAARWSKLITAAKTRILGIPAECKSRQADLPLAVIAVIDNVCREVLEDLANGRD